MPFATALTVFLLLSQVPAEDARYTNTPNTNTHFQMPLYRTRADWEARKTALRRQILIAAGLVPLPERTPLNAQVFGRIERKDYSVEKVLLETMPGYYLGGNLYRPRRGAGQRPGVVTPHGHWRNGRLESSSTFSGQALGIHLARLGMVAFAYDMVGYNDTLQTPHDFGGRADEQMWSFGPLGLQLWNSIRALDFVESLPDVDPLKLAATGASGGGTQAFLLAAIDERLRFAAPVNMVSAIMQGGSPCENAPGLRVGAYNVEFAAMMAPRPMLLVSATGDWTRNVPKEEYPDIRRIYDLYDRPNDVEVVQFEAEHNFNRASREAVYGFFAKRMLASEAPVAESNTPEERIIDMLALHGRALPQAALTFAGVFDQWKAMSERQAAAMSEEDLRARLRDVLGAMWPAKVLSERRGESVVLSREEARDRVTGIWLPGKSGRAALVVHPAGAAVARATAQVQKLVEAGDTVLLIDAFQTTAAASPRDRSGRHFLTFNRSDDALRVQDALTALAYLTREHRGEVQLVGIDDAAAWCLYAAAIAPVRVKLAPASDAGERFFAPGVLRAGGAAVARRLAGVR